ncbi:MAG: methyltransferase domain-containing protein [Tabrizicola sp.]|jgi:phosphatidylethanolamine/phosphatidyl-N-methylethanolamine N-methyltransferase|uniref:class I SAM-dependent methyltransferase n=1 Tax=Tabrizicola sp. TaxID=2005166 RepID=UPI001B422A64|nr:methyltransferase domain-containing protein [Tabrizicola sp.]HQY44789.1 methyltransferase domain-containing protein [Paracoccaceae bacterium]
MQVEAIQKSYRRWAPVYDLTFGRITQGGRKIAAGHVNAQGGSVLEVGIGTGLALDFYAPHVRVTGIDVSVEMLREAEIKARKRGLRSLAGLHQMDARQLAFPDASFDHVAAMHVMSVVPEPERVLDEMARVTRPGGSVLIANHFAGRAEGWTFVERLAAPLADLLGWHADFAIDRVLGHPKLRLEETRQVRPFGLMTFLRFRRVEG